MYQFSNTQIGQLPPYALSTEERIEVLANLILDKIQAMHEETDEQDV